MYRLETVALLKKKKSRKKQNLGEIVMHDFFYVTESAS